MKKRLAILGSTGSIGRSTLDVVARNRERFEVVALTAGRDVASFARQVEVFRPRMISLAESHDVDQLRTMMNLDGITVYAGQTGNIAAATSDDVDLVVSAIVGAAGLQSTFAAVSAGKDVALANKESLVVGGKLITDTMKTTGAKLLPIDSEHSAIFQALQGHRKEEIRKIILTASGGPFRSTSLEQLKTVTPEDALRHPTWSMGNKITIDSATMMNKGLEVIEATWLFDLQVEKIDVIIHPQSIIHSMVEYMDGSVIAQMSNPDMRGPIAYALSYPERSASGLEPLNLAKVGTLTFEAIDVQKFPCLRLAYMAGNSGGSMPCVLNAANEIAVSAFLEKKIAYLDIGRVVEETMQQHRQKNFSTLEEILQADHEARNIAEGIVQAL